MAAAWCSEAVGALWRKSLPDGVPQRLQPAQAPEADGTLRFEYSAAWSPDGRWNAYTTWKEGEGGHVWKQPAQGGKPQRLTRVAGEYLHPAWRADGRTIVVTQGAGASFRGDAIGDNPWFALVELPAAGGSTRELLPLANNGVALASTSTLLPLPRVQFTRKLLPSIFATEKLVAPTVGACASTR